MSAQILLISKDFMGMKKSLKLWSLWKKFPSMYIHTRAGNRSDFWLWHYCLSMYVYVYFVSYHFSDFFPDTWTWYMIWDVRGVGWKISFESQDQGPYQVPIPIPTPNPTPTHAIWVPKEFIVCSSSVNGKRWLISEQQSPQPHDNNKRSRKRRRW